MSDPTPSVSPATSDVPEWRRYLRFLGNAVSQSVEGGWKFYVWMTLLTAIFLVGANAWAIQVRDGMAVTGMSDHVSWALYIANFTFLVGLAAGGVMMVIPAYLYNDKEMHDIVLIGELLAIASVIMAIMFVVCDLGRPDRFWHMMPIVGKFNFPISMLTWDVIVLNGYLLINVHICGYLLYKRYRGQPPVAKMYVPFVFLSIIWAISIHTVTAFLYCGLGGRPFWNTALLAPRFLTSAFVSGPAFIIVAIQIIRRLTHHRFGDGAIRTLVGIIRITILVNLLMVASEVFVEFYTGGSHTGAAKYLYFGLHGHHELVPWIWTAVAFNIIAAIMFMRGRLNELPVWLNTACFLAFAGIWIEKGMGMIIPAFIPSALHEIVEYRPSLTEWKVTAGIWALGFMIYTLLLKITINVYSRNMRDAQGQRTIESKDALAFGEHI
ncbi:sulfate reduction electron transfer complex DsrMKJOP subunit DsrP [Prosthecobacter sp.]|uniref:sulfate reduction electron transfer complex DsrMKJOP subunit DsrP n=1 Tax=Prosthecobacter sp. TaxID=1965333 RepID=UPI002AB864ED|nr:NrfD/PsrC family molybdoenzyme membrane anchor subunit [Prosthecobacter sp.]MDZ4402522.1 NrfD/PsrC family molybdoenzyme membrane anchor subunit [Prosthecobacter sp.]